MTQIAFLGLGAMGSRMAAALVSAGHDVTVWNRTADRMAALIDLGARGAETPRAAAKGAEIVIAMLRDDAASDAVWRDPATGAFAGMAAGALGIECSTLSPGHVQSLHATASDRGIGFLDAPLAGSRPQAEAKQLIFMVGGKAEEVSRAEPVLGDIGAAVHHAGASGAGTVVKLMVNTLFAAQLATLAELLGLAQRSGVDPDRALHILGATPVASPAAKMSGSAMLAGAFAPAFPIDLVRKDMGLAHAAADDVRQDLPLARATASVFEKAARHGHGADNITAVARLYLASRAAAPSA